MTLVGLSDYGWDRRMLATGQRVCDDLTVTRKLKRSSSICAADVRVRND
jgi:hypothetical protein